MAFNEKEKLFSLATQTPLVLALDSQFNYGETVMAFLFPFHPTLPLAKKRVLQHYAGPDKPWEKAHVFGHFWLPYSPVL